MLRRFSLFLICSLSFAVPFSVYAELPATLSTDATYQISPATLAEAKALAARPENYDKTLTFLLAPGEYGKFELKATSRGAWVTYQAADSVRPPIFRGSGISAAITITGSPAAHIKFINIAAYADKESAVEIENSGYVSLENSLFQGAQAKAVLGYAVSIASSDHISVLGSIIKNGTNGVSINGVNYLNIADNDIGYALIDGVHLGDASDFLITNNTVHDIADPAGIYPDAHQDSLQIDAGQGGVRRGNISLNRFRDSSGQGVYIARSAHNQTYILDSLTFAQNTISGNFGASPLQIEGSNLVISNNILNPTAPFASAILETARKITLTNNIFNGKFINCGAETTQSGNIFADLLQTGCSSSIIAPLAPVQTDTKIILAGQQDFNGTTDKIVVSGTSSTLSRGSGAYSISARIKAADLAVFNKGDGNGILISLADSDGEQGDFALTVDASGRVAFFNWRSSGNAQTKYLTPEGTIVAGNWYLITAVFDSVSSKIYVNGIEKPLIAGYLGVGNQPGTYVGTFYPPSSSWYWQGSLQDIQVYSRALSASEIAE